MRTADLLQTSVQSLKRNRSRSALTILGIVIGITAVILTLSIGQSAQGLILGQVADLGSDLIFIEAGSGKPKSGPPDPFVEQTLSLDDVRVLEKSPLFAAVSPVIASTTPASRGDVSQYVQVDGITPEHLAIFPADVAEGRFIDDTDVSTRARVVVLGKDVAADFFGNEDPVGKRIELRRQSFRVVGVMAEQGSRFFQNLDARIALPITTLQKDLLGVDYVTYISLRANGSVELAKEETIALMRDAHNIDNPTNDLNLDDFLVSTQSDAVQTVGVIGAVLTILLSSIAAISLIVGGIGIMNIMLVSVTERTREIGLRKAVGAREEDILRQFLIEAVALTGIGGLIGVTLGILFSLGAGHLASQYVDGWSAVIPPQAIVLAVVVSSLIGIAFGYYPAKRAARLDPIDALRHE